MRPEDFEFADRCLGKMAELAVKELHLDHANDPGAGAAGGLGYGLRCFAGARLEPGFGVFARHAELNERIKSAQLVVTGEGAIDAQTLMGKGVGELAGVCRAGGVPCVGLAGVVTDAAQARRLFAATHALTPDFVAREQALTDTAACLERLAAHAAEQWKE